tara:strand:+ start:467 stop:733 length:267 start_codon:yes stop_codon:yes gene_type:complete
MIISYNTFKNGTEVDLTNQFHTTPTLTLFFTKRNDVEFFTIKNFMTDEVWHNFATTQQHDLNHVCEFCNKHFDTNFKTIPNLDGNGCL